MLMWSTGPIPTLSVSMNHLHIKKQVDIESTSESTWIPHDDMSEKDGYSDHIYHYVMWYSTSVDFKDPVCEIVDNWLSFPTLLRGIR